MVLVENQLNSWFKMMMSPSGFLVINHYLYQHFCIINVILLGPELLDSYNILGHEMVSDGNTVYYVNTYSNVILKLDCLSDLASCAWTKMKQTLKYPRTQSLAFLVPDELTECSEA